MVWRGISARRALSATLFVLSALVVAGTVLAVSFSSRADVSRGTAGALVLVGLVALTGQASESVRRREPEIALARLRGRHGVGLLMFAVREQAVVVVAGALAGVVAGWVTTTIVVHAWLPDSGPVRLGTAEWLAAAAVTLGSLLLVALASRPVLRTTLVVQLAAARRPRGLSTTGLFLQLVLVIGAGVSIYQADRAATDRADWLSLLAPALVGLAAGQIVIWAVLAVLAFVVPRRTGSSMGWFLTERRLLRRADSMSVVRLVVAAGVVFGVAASASTAAQNWREDRARLQTGGPVSYPVPGGALRAYAASRSADPSGRWLVAVASYTDELEGPSRRVFVDTSRWPSVVGDFLADTPSADLDGMIDRLRPMRVVQVAKGDAAEVTLDGSPAAGSTLRITYQYVDDNGNAAAVTVPLRPGGGTALEGGSTRYRAPVRGCADSCSIIEVDLDGLVHRPGQTVPPVHVTGLTFAGQDLLRPASGMQEALGQVALDLTRTRDGIEIQTRGSPGNDSWVLGTFRPDGPAAAVRSGAFRLDKGSAKPEVAGVDGSARPATVVGALAALPFVGTRGTLLDLPGTLLGAGGSVPETDARVIAAAGTPASVIAALRRAGAEGRPTTFERVLHGLNTTPRALGTRLYVLIAVIAGLIALVSIASTLAQQSAERRREAAGLRIVGFAPAAISGAYRREAFVLAGATAVGIVVAAWIASRVLLPALPLVSGWAFAPPLDSAPRTVFLAVAAAVTGLLVGVVAWLAFRRIGRTSPPRLLREEST